MSGELDDYFAQEKAATLDSSVRGAVGVSAPRAAEVDKLATASGLPYDTVDQNLDEVKSRTALDDFMKRDLVNTHPEVASFLSNPANSKVALDDVDHLSAIERGMTLLGKTSLVYQGVKRFQESDRSAGEITKNLLKQGYVGTRYDTVSGALGVAAAISEMGGEPTTEAMIARSNAVTRPQIQTRDGTVPVSTVTGQPMTDAEMAAESAKRLEATPIPVAQGSVAEALLNEAGAVKAEADALAGDQSKLGFLERGIGSGMRSLGSNAVPTALSVLTGNPLPMVLGGTAVTTGQAYEQARPDLTAEQSLRFAGFQGAVETVTEMIPGVKLFKDIKLGSPMWKTMLTNQVQEQIGEQTATALQDFAEFIVLPENKDKTIGDYLAARPEAALQTAIATLVASTVQSGAAAGVGKLVEHIDAATFSHDQFEQVLDAATNAKVRELAPERFTEFLQSATGGRTVYVDQEQLQKLADEGVTLPPSIVSQLNGGTADIAVTMRDVLTNPEIAVKLRDHIRFAPDSMTRTEANDAKEQAVKDMVQAAQERIVRDTELQSLHQGFTQQIAATGRMNEQDASTSASLLTARIATLADERGMTYSEAAQRLGLTVEGPQTAAAAPGGTVLDQSVETAGATTPAEIEDARKQWVEKGTDSPYFQKFFEGSKVVDKAGKPLVVYHGTASDFDTFDVNADPLNYEVDRGKQFFLSNPKGASGYAEGTSDFVGGNANVLPVYLSMKNPRIETVKGSPAVWWDNQPDRFWDMDVAGKYDGLIVKGTGETMYVTSDPSQIKSATGNQGTFDAREPSILKQQPRLEAPGVKLTDNVQVAETGETLTVERDAERLFAQTQKRREMVQKIAECMRRG